MTEQQGEQLLALAAQQYAQDIDQTAQLHDLVQVGLYEAWLVKLLFFLLFLACVVVFALLKPRKAG